jgi:hypothetical protein
LRQQQKTDRNVLILAIVAILLVVAIDNRKPIRRWVTSKMASSAETSSTPSPPPATLCPCRSNELDCPHFDGRHSAETCYELCYQLTGIDVHLLDADGDGHACESLTD